MRFKIEKIKDNTWCILARDTLIPFYKLDENNIVLIDSGSVFFAGELLRFIEENGLHVSGILTSHTHIDHIGAHGLLQNKHHSEIAASFVDSAISSNKNELIDACGYLPMDMRTSMWRTVYFNADAVIMPTDTEVTLCGTKFGVLQLPGHTASHLGFVTPDDVAYLGDAMISHHSKIAYAHNLPSEIATRENILKTDHEIYAFAHKGWCTKEELPEIAELNQKMIDEMMDIFTEIIDHEMGQDEIFLALIAKLGIDAEDPMKMLQSRAYLAGYLSYLVLLGRAKLDFIHGCLRFSPVD